MNIRFDFLKKNFFKKYRLSTLCLLLSVCSYFTVNAQQAAEAPPAKTLWDSPLFVILLSIVILLFFVVLVFAKVARAGIQFRQEQNRKKNGNSTIASLLLLFFVSSFSNSSMALSVAVEEKTSKSDYWGMDATTFYLLIGMIAFEILVICKFYNIAMQQLGAVERKKRLAEVKAKELAKVKRPSFIEKMNDSVAMDKEEGILLDHEYDGIRELDNNLPPWWKYGFYLTIVVSVIYMFRFHVFHTGKSQVEEYEQQLLQAKWEMAEYRKKAANLVDENNATLLTDGASLASGKSIYKMNCVACHGEAGEGGVGPNLADDYWLHNGDVKDIFKTIKYGYPEKGMKAWQQDLGAKQIHEVSSYIKSMKGTKPANAKAPEGELYIETSDSTKVAK